jgi:hypothetical protein
MLPSKPQVPNSLVNHAEYLEAYAEQDATLGRPNPRYKQSTIYCNKYLEVRSDLVGSENFTDDEWDLTIF